MKSLEYSARFLLLNSYLKRSAQLNPLEDPNTTVPPSMEEIKGAIAYLGQQGANPKIVGSLAALYYSGVENFRPTKDVDVFVSKVPSPPAGWKQDRGSPGVTSWISPSGGYIDLLPSGFEFTTGFKYPKSLKTQPETEASGLPMGSFLDIFKLKLGTMRDKDLLDLVSMARGMGRIPEPKELGTLNQTQKENLAFVRQWLEQRPQGKYGE